jgi:multiple sugar transport system permease protein
MSVAWLDLAELLAWVTWPLRVVWVRIPQPIRDTLEGYLYLLPALLVLIGFHVLPIFYAFYISLFSWRVAQGPFVGLANYGTALANPEFWDSLKVTVYYAMGVVIGGIVLSVLIGYALTQRIRGRSIYRLIYFLPYVTPIVAAALVWRWIFHAQYGILNFALGLIGLPAQQWLLEPRGIFEILLQPTGVAPPGWAVGPSLAMFAIIVFTVWHSVGFGAVIVMAGLSNIPNEVYDAARIDGAGSWPLLWNITLPLLSPTLFFLMVVSTIGAFQSFSGIYVMTDPSHGGPLGTTQNATMYIFRSFYELTRLGYGSAVAFLLFFVVLGLTILQVRVIGPRVHYQ